MYKTIFVYEFGPAILGVSFESYLLTHVWLKSSSDKNKVKA